MDTRLLLQANCERLLEQYEANMKLVQELQSTLIEDVLPSVAGELSLDSDQIDWAKEWLEDTQTMFQILRREKFTRSFAIESIRKNLLWRFQKLWPLGPETHLSNLHFLPPDVRDPFGRPIIIIQALGFKNPSEEYAPLLIRIMEQLRLRLRTLNSGSDHTPATLQYIVLFDAKELSVKTLNVDMISWVLRDLIPRFPGMLAAVFMVNSAWTHSGIWNIVKRVLPASAVSRVFFSSPQELVAYFTPSSLPKDYGGYLPSLNACSRGTAAIGRTRTPPYPEQDEPYLPSNTTKPAASSSPVSLSPTSQLNPFFGYPALNYHGYSSLHHGRRRKRDLLRTLAALFWLRWRRPITLCLWLVALLFAGRLWFRKWVLHSPSGWALLKTWLFSSVS